MNSGSLLLASVLLCVALTGCADGDTVDVPAPLAVSIEADPLSLVFTNRSAAPVRLLKPLDGSLGGMIMPRYDFEVRDAAGAVLDHMSRCGNFGLPYHGTKWPEDYLVVLGAGESFRLPIELPHLVPESGEYVVSFRYVFDGSWKTTPGGDYPPGLWVGQVEAAPVRVFLVDSVSERAASM